MYRGRSRGSYGDSYEGHGGHGGYGGDYGANPQLSRKEQTVRSISTLLFTFADKGPLRDSIELAAVALEREYAATPALFLDAFKICLSQVPTKTGVYATITGIINVRNQDMAKAIVAHVAGILTAALRDNHFRTAKLAVRFLAECVNANIVLPAQFVSVLDTLLAVTIEPDVRQERSDAFVFLVLAALPWVGAQLRDREPDHLERIVNGMGRYFDIRSSKATELGLTQVITATSMYRYANTDNQQQRRHHQMDKLELLWIQVQHLRDANWESGILLRPYDFFEDTLGQAVQHEIPTIDLPSTLIPIKFNYQPRFWIFDDEVITDDRHWGHLPLTSDISRFILADMATDVIRIFSLNHTEATQILLRLESSFDADYLERTDTIVLEAVIESIFAELFRLPKSQEKFVYYATLIIDLCKSAKDTVPSIFGRAIKTLFQRLDTPGSGGIDGMDVEGVRRLSELFAQHLSNFGYHWKWAEWSYVLEASETAMTDAGVDANGNGDSTDSVAVATGVSSDAVINSAQFVFIRETLERCIRLSYWERIKGTIPESFVGHPSGVFPASAPSYKYSYESAETAGGDAGLVHLVARLNTAISQRKDASEVQECIDHVRRYAMGETIALDDGTSVEPTLPSASQQDPALADGDAAMAPVTVDPDAADRIARDALIQTVMLQGSKSFSHILNVIERYVTLIQSHATTPESRIHVIDITSVFWYNNTQMIEIIFDKLIHYRIVDPKTVLSWAMHPTVLETQATRFYVWSVVRNTLAKVNLKVTQIGKKLKSARLDVTASPTKSISGAPATTTVSVSTLESAYEAATREKKETLIFFFQKYIEIVTTKITQIEDLTNTNNHDDSNVDVDPTASYWWRWVIGFFREITRAFKDDFEMVKNTIDVVLFTPDVVDERVLDVWTAFKRVSDMHQDDVA